MYSKLIEYFKYKLIMDSKKTNEENRKQGSTSQQGKGSDKHSDSKSTKQDSGSRSGSKSDKDSDKSGSHGR